MSTETKITAAQKLVLIGFMEDHEEFSKGKLLGSAGRKRKLELWSQLTARLNACEGPSKNATKWQKVWIDLKNKIKKKAGVVRRYRGGTGGGPKCKIECTEIEERLIAMLTEEGIHGLEEPGDLPLDSAEPSQQKKVEVIQIEVASASTSPQATTDESEGDVWPSTSQQVILTRASEDEEILPVPQSTPRSRKRQRTQPVSAAAEAAQTFAKIGDTLNNKVDHVVQVLQELVEEKRQTNCLLRELINCLEQKHQ